MKHIIKNLKKMRKLRVFEIIYISLLVMTTKNATPATSTPPSSNVIVNVYVISKTPDR